MSRVGNLPINISSGVTVSVSPGNHVIVKGSKGELSQAIAPSIKVVIEDKQVKLSRATEKKEDKAFHGLSRALINNMVIGVSEGYQKTLELVGVGYRATNEGNLLDLVLGYSHHYVLQLPPEINVKTEQVKGQTPKIILESIDKQLVGQIASHIRSLRKPEPYKGKGVKFIDEIIRKKAGKSAQKAK